MPAVGGGAFEVAAAGEERVPETAVLVQDSAGAFAEERKSFEGEESEPLGGMRGDDAEEIVEAVHAPGEVGAGQDPAAAEAGESVHLGQAAGDEDGLIEAMGRDGVGIEGGVEVDLVDEDPGAGAAGQFRDRAKRVGRDARTGGVVEVGEDDQSGAGRDRGFQAGG